MLCHMLKYVKVKLAGIEMIEITNYKFDFIRE